MKSAHPRKRMTLVCYFKISVLKILRINFCPPYEGEESKKKRVMAPRPKLDAARLGSARGLLALEAEMRGVKLQGRGHELADLDVVMGRLQHWAHRLFPSYTFDDCLDKLEKLGSKKTVAV